MNRFLIVLLWGMSTCILAESLTIADKGNSDWQIIIPTQATPEEENSAKILAESIKKSTGAELAIVSENIRVATKPSFFIGKTDYTFQAPQSSQNLMHEEWEIIGAPDNIIIHGGAPRGTMYGVFDFLEQFLQIRHYGLGIEKIPQHENLSIQLPLSLKKQPAFKYRSIYYVTKGIDEEKFHRFNSQVGINGYGDIPQYGFSEKYGRPIGCHSYLYYTEDFPVEISWMAANGKRTQVKQTTQGQICYSLPVVREKFIEKLKNYIRQDRQEADQKNAPYPIFYDISANDCQVDCFCPECKNLAAKYGKSGMIIDFTNHIAAAIEKEFPDIFIIMFAYNNAKQPPRHIAVRDNVIVRIAFMDSEFGDDEKRDVFRPINHPFNQDYVKNLREWSKVAKNIAIWDYWKHYSSIAPKTLVQNLPELIQTYHQLGVKHFFVEAEINSKYIQPDSFIDLRTYAGAKLMVDPDLNMKDLLDDFFQGYYGPAAVPMREYFDYLIKRMEEEPSILGQLAVTKWRYLDADFFRTTERIFTVAEERCNGDRKYLDRIALEKLVVDMTQLNMGEKFQSSPNNLDKTALLERMIQNIDIYGKKYYQSDYWQSIKDENIQYFTSIYQNPKISLPEEFIGKNVIDLTWDKINAAQAISDPEAAGGKTIKVPQEKYTGNQPFHGRNLEFGLYASAEKKVLLQREIAQNELPQDEKYHLYFLGRTNIPQQARIWIHWTWWLTVPLNTVYDPTLQNTPMEIYVSMKCQGPAYVPASQLPNAVLVDRILLVQAHNSVPEQFKNSNAIKIPYSELKWKSQYIIDEDSTEKMAACPVVPSDKPDFHNKKPALGIYDGKQKKYLANFEIKPENIPKDEKYHLYKIGTTKLTEDTTIWGHFSWSMVCTIKKQPVQYDTTYSVYVSLKLQGPAYVKNSTKTNNFLIDQIWLVPSQQ